ncbi:metal-dependent transcriptional regulator [Candidatus Kaiserbacteria bacterium]|nr:metal-dependent transcriptional regulator [Candidatus Kaiserbacteria bacterium]
MTKQISDTREDYIRAIYILDSGLDEVGVTQIAAKLKLSKSTVSERLRDLVRDGLVETKPYASVTLTEKGFNLGKKLTYKHRIIEVFLNETLGLPKSKVHEEAHRLEHAVSDEVIKRLAKYIGHPDTDPHGSKIPTIKDWK